MDMQGASSGQLLLRFIVSDYPEVLGPEPSLASLGSMRTMTGEELENLFPEITGIDPTEIMFAICGPREFCKTAKQLVSMHFDAPNILVW